jgi:hypothetical protein
VLSKLPSSPAYLRNRPIIVFRFTERKRPLVHDVTEEPTQISTPHTHTHTHTHPRLLYLASIYAPYIQNKEFAAELMVEIKTLGECVCSRKK